jgi:hypothetical protein
VDTVGKWLPWIIPMSHGRVLRRHFTSPQQLDQPMYWEARWRHEREGKKECRLVTTP